VPYIHIFDWRGRSRYQSKPPKGPRKDERNTTSSNSEHEPSLLVFGLFPPLTICHAFSLFLFYFFFFKRGKKKHQEEDKQNKMKKKRETRERERETQKDLRSSREKELFGLF
jgi:hypothetical protein